MKKIYFLLFALIILSVSCGLEERSAKKNLSKAAEVVNNSTPLQVDYMTTLTSCRFDGKHFIYYYEVNEDYTYDIHEFEEDMRENLQYLWDTDPQFDEIKDNLKKVDGAVIYNYVGDTSGDMMTIIVRI